ncbi:MAG: alpha/beta hydrolase, partial [Lachnospiraceae bacterium]|nr:alpha/beta hydrolase [Lachnospiraceae bacterium]
MQQQVFELSQEDGHLTKLYAFLCDDAPRASLLVLHGMAEHHKRYLGFAQTLADNGVDVYLYDHRGHGTDCKLEELGHLASSKGYRKLIDDARAVAGFIRQTKRSEPYFIFGHSMGSLVTRCVLQKDDAFSGAMICGSTCPSKAVI